MSRKDAIRENSSAKFQTNSNLKINKKGVEEGTGSLLGKNKSHLGGG
jgi:hypothetical protein